MVHWLEIPKAARKISQRLLTYPHSPQELLEIKGLQLNALDISDGK